MALNKVEALNKLSRWGWNLLVVKIQDKRGPTGQVHCPRPLTHGLLATRADSTFLCYTLVTGLVKRNICVYFSPPKRTIQFSSHWSHL